MSWIKDMNELGHSRIPFFFLISFDKKDAMIIPLDKLPKEIAFKINDHRHELGFGKRHSSKLIFNRHPKPFAEYLTAFNKVIKRIKYGDSFLVNLTIPTPIDTNFSLKKIYADAHAKYKLLINEKLVVFSPECFVKIIDNFIYSFPMKGTIDAAIIGAEALLLNDEKEKSEHYTIVDLIRNDISQISKNVTVTKFRYIDTIHTNDKVLLQSSSEIKGELRESYHDQLGDIFDKLLPAGSISGAPKAETLSIIEEAEDGSRGFYTGVFGIYDGKNLDSGVAIRFIEKTANGLVYRSGGGLTAMSDAECEYKELVDKVYVPTGRKYLDKK
jgi:para-aminobenzoate synthetase component I